MTEREPPYQATIAGIPVTVVSQDEAENAGMVGCIRYHGVMLYFSDNEIGTCSRCGHQVQFRPYAPKKPPKVCMECLLVKQ